MAYTEGDAATAIDGSLGVSDPDSATLSGATVRITDGLRAGDALSFVGTPPISGSYDGGTGALTLSGSASPAAYQAALRSVRYRSTSDDPGTSRTVAWRVQDGPVSSEDVTTAIAITPVNDAPLADDETFGAALGNTRLAVGTTSTGPHVSIAGDVLTGDTDPDTPAAGLSAGPGSITSANGGNVTMEPDGQFTYDPAPRASRAGDTFTYTASDGDATDTGQVTITVAAPRVWYVDGTPPRAATGARTRRSTRSRRSPRAAARTASTALATGSSSTTPPPPTRAGSCSRRASS